MSEYYEAHCSGCGNVTTADLLAFDFGRLFNRAIEKAEQRALGSSDKWIPMLKLDLGFYYVWRDLAEIYGLKENRSTHLEFTVRHLREHLSVLAQVPFEKIAELPDVNNLVYQRLTRAIRTPLQKGKRATRQDIDIMDHAENIRTLVDLCSERGTMDEDEVIAEFDVQVYMEEDDRGNPFPSKLAVIYEDEEQENVVNNVCPHCGKQFHSLVGKYQEFIICMAGSARVGKTAYLAALMYAIEKHGNKYAQHVYGTDNPDYRFFSENIMKPYRENKRIPKTAFEGSGETIPLFSAPIRVLDRTYLFTFIDMPGEAFDSDDISSGAKFIINDKKIVKHAQMIWFCIDPQQIDAEVASMNHVATAQDDKVNENTRQVMENIGQTLAQVCLEGKKNAAVLVTKSDLILGKGGFDSLFRPDEHAFRDYVREDGAMDFDHEKQFSHKAYEYLDQAHGIIATISGMFEDYTSFAVAAYGMNVNPIEDDDIRAMMGDNLHDAEKNPSMVELPFLWTAAELGLIPATKVVEEWIPPKKIGPIIVKPGYYVQRLVQVSQKELFVK